MTATDRHVEERRPGNSTVTADGRTTMSRRTAAVLATASIIASFLGGCTSPDDPYDALTSEASAFVVPGSEDWTSGALCPDGGDCSGPITASVITYHDWHHITDLTIAGGDEPTDGPVTARLTVSDTRAAAAPREQVVEIEVWGPDVDDVEGVLAAGFEVWVGVDPELDVADVFAAFDAGGRVAGIGNAAAEYFTIPVAQLAADAQAPSAFAYLDPLMAE